jgi:hypothetical protein
MNVREFLSELQLFFPLERKREDIPRILEGYADDILYEINKNRWKGYNCEFEILLKKVRASYSFSSFPPLAKIIDCIPEAMVIKPIETSYSGREGEVIKKTYRGYEYEFTVVPNHWKDVKTISELEAEIEKNNKREIA